ncbi:hypothetical protein HK096_007511 [Nowakowskiella sp. JEL0078]|nr:hypothetical protein HK096_007511 [Nowakowskiella sp. JEL0078]
MESGSEVFATYEREYATLQEAIRAKISSNVPAASGEQRKLVVNQAERELEEADEIIGQMEIELQSLAISVRTKLQPRVRIYKDEVKKFKNELKKAASGNERDQLLGRSLRDSHVVDFEVESQDQRSRLLKGTDRLQDGSRRLEDARRLALETEAIGISTLEDLNRQREQILGTADTFIAKSQGVLKQMQRSIATNKLLTAGIIAALVLIIIVIVYMKWFR